MGHRGGYIGEDVKAAAGNESKGFESLSYLLEVRGDEIKITEDVVQAAAGNQGSGERVMALLLEMREDEIKITEDVVRAAAGNQGSGERVMALLLERRGDHMKITENLVFLIAANFPEHAMGLLLEKRGDEIKIISTPIYAQTNGIFTSLEKLANDCAKSDPVISHEAEKTRARFEKWCQRLGAHFRGVSSLDERLRDASVVKRHILDCLSDINNTLQEAQKMSPQPGHILAPFESHEKTALQILLAKSTISDPLGFTNSILDVLFRVIPVIRPALSADRYKKAMSTTLPNEEDFIRRCRTNLKDLFPELSPQLLGRLVSASLQRRRLFEYTGNYSKFQSNVGWNLPSTYQHYPAISPLPPFAKIGSGDTESILSTADLNLSLLDPFNQEDPIGDIDTKSISSTARSNRKTLYSLPPFPADSEDGLRECVACHLTLPLPTEAIWRAHILRDIRPYVCTFPDCSVDPNKLYSSRRAWFEHEVAFHRRQWPCSLGCATIMTDLTSFRGHVTAEHPSHVYELPSHPPPQGLEIPANAETLCPFCRETIKSRRNIESHIGLHQLEVSLMHLQSSIIEVSDG